MANAKKCDLCGKFYERPICNDTVRIYLESSIYPNHYIDLCNDCYNELCNFIKPAIPENYSVERQKVTKNEQALDR